MRPDIVDLSQFYASSLGLTARDILRHKIMKIWPDLKGRRVLGLGYPTPFLRPMLAEAERVSVLMPASQGVIHWPPEGPSAVALGEEYELPFVDSMFDRILLVHSLEGCQQPHILMREIWRILAPEGRILVIVPNRRGVWSRWDTTPFGHGHPYSFGQLERLLKDNLFRPHLWSEALFFPPWSRKFWHKGARSWEWLGERIYASFAGVLMAEATKQVYAVRPIKVEQMVPTRQRQAKWLPVNNRKMTLPR